MSIPDWLPGFAVSLIAVAISTTAFFRSGVAARAQTYLEFRKRFSDIKGELPKWYVENDRAKWPAFSDPGWRVIELYWQNTFDEWLVTSELGERHLRRLWKRFYRIVLRDTLLHKPLRYSVSRLIHGQEFGPRRMDFKRVLDSLWREHDAGNVGICDGFGCQECRDGSPQRE